MLETNNNEGNHHANLVYTSLVSFLFHLALTPLYRKLNELENELHCHFPNAVKKQTMITFSHLIRLSV